MIKRAADLIMNARRITVFTGAGMSTESGIPDFRSPGGIWSKADPQDFTIQRFMSSSESRRKHWKLFSDYGLMRDIKPNPGHYALAELEKLGKLQCVITQNIDNLHQKAGCSEDRVLELHGSMQRVICTKCKTTRPIEEPVCQSCGGILKPDAVLFGEMLPQQVLTSASEYARASDLFIVVGSTLVVYPAAFMPVYALEAGAKLIIINLSPTPLDEYADVRISGKAGVYLPVIAAQVKEGMKLKR